MLRWINSAIFTAGKILMNMLMMYLLKVRFVYFYADYGCFIWTVFTIQDLSLLIQTTIDALISQNEAVSDFVLEYRKSNPVLTSILQITFNIVCFIVPVLTQLSCLIFVWIRNTRGSK